MTENDVEKIESTNLVLYCNIDDKAKFEILKCKFVMREYYSNYFLTRH